MLGIFFRIMRMQVTIIMTVYIMEGKVKACVLSLLTIHRSKDELAAVSREVLAVTSCASSPYLHCTSLIIQMIAISHSDYNRISHNHYDHISCSHYDCIMQTTLQIHVVL